MPPPSLPPPRDLTIPEPGSTTARDVLSRAIGRLLKELPRVGQGAPISEAGRADLAAFHRAVRRALAEHPGAVASTMRRPTAAALLRCLRPGRLPAARVEPALSELQAIVYLELAAARALPEPARVRRPPARIVSLAARAVIELPDDATAIAFEDGRLTAIFRDGEAALPLDALSGAARDSGPIRIARPYTEIEGEIPLALADNNPVALEEAHPDKAGNAVDLGGYAPEAWAAALRAALAPIGRHLPDLRREMDLFVHQIVPVGFDATQHQSASYQEAIGTLYMTLHPSVMTLAEALIHEFSHNKLNALFELDDVLENAFAPLYASPVRPDPRPLHGVLLAVHAFLPVARLYERMIAAGDPLAEDPSFAGRFDRICAINREGADVLLRHGRPTPIGRGVLEEIARWTDHFSRGDPIRSR
jgi:HEXXH motif-containing protein